MGCCTSRNTLLEMDNRKSIEKFIKDTKINSLSCFEIERLGAQILKHVLDRPTYEMLSKNWDLIVPFDLLSLRGTINKFDLQITLLLFSKDPYQNIMKTLEKLCGNDKRKIMRFIEWRYQLLNERVPAELFKLNLIEKSEYKNLVENSRLKAGYEVCLLYKQITTEINSLDTINLIFIS